MKRHFNHLMTKLTAWLQQRYSPRITKAYGIFPPDMKTTFRRDLD